MARKLEDKFITDLKEGELKIFLELVQKDDTLDLEIRENYINIYYRGGSIDRISCNKDGKYQHYFHPNYLGGKSIGEITTDKFPEMKRAMDLYEKKQIEKEFQQLIVRENNYSKILNDSDYYIADIEYQVGANNRSDMIAIKLESESQKKKNPDNLELAIIEVKYGDGSLKGKSGMIDHLEKAKDIDIKSLQKEMKECFNQKHELGLFPDLEHQIKGFIKQEKIDFIFILINHDPAKSALGKVLKEIKEKKDNGDFPKLNIKFAVSNFAGYALYKENIYSLEDFMEKFGKQIYSK